MKLSKLSVMLLLGAAVTTGFTSCSNNDDNGGDSTDVVMGQSEVQNVVSTYVNDVVYYTYTTLANYSEDLYEQAVKVKANYEAGKLTDADIEKACEDFENARKHYEISEAFLFGAATDYDIDPHIDSWPLDQGQMAQFMSDPALVAGLYGSDPIAFVNSNYAKFDTAIGFHGIEFVLFRDGAPRKAAAFNGLEDHESFKGKNVQAKDELAFLVAVAGDVRDHCYQMEVAWKGDAADKSHIARVTELGVGLKAQNGNGYYYGQNMLVAGTDDPKSTMHSLNEAISTILGSKGCANICNEVAEQKLGQAYRVATGKPSLDPDEPDASDYIESPYSKRSFIDYRDNLYSIKNSLYGNFEKDTPEANSILSLLKKYNYSKVNDLENALNTAIQSLTTPINDGKHFVDDPGAAYVGTAIDAIAALNQQLTDAASWIEKVTIK